MYVQTRSPFKRAALVDCRGSGNKVTARRDCAVEWDSTGNSCLLSGALAF